MPVGDDDDLNRLADELETLDRDLPRSGGRLDAWLEIMAARGASDLLLLAGEPPVLRIDGLIARAGGALLDSEDIESPVVPLAAFWLPSC